MDLASLGAGGGVVFIILTTVFGFLLKWQKNKYDNTPSTKMVPKTISSSEFKEVHNWTRDLYNWHNRMDEDGIPVWYVSRAHLTALQEIQKTLAALQMISEAQFKLLEKIEDRIDHSRRERTEDRFTDRQIDRFEDRVKEQKIERLEDRIKTGSGSD